MTNTDTDTDADADTETETERATQESWADADNWHDSEWNDPPLNNNSSTTTLLAHLGFGITLGGLAAFFVMLGVVLAGGAPAWMATLPIGAVLLGFVMVGSGTTSGESTDEPNHRRGD